MHDPRYVVFFDFHTSPMLTGIGKNLDVKLLMKRLSDAKVDYFCFPARCNMGMAYYDTALGIRHPGLDFDLFGRLREEAQKHKIAVGAYFNAGLSYEEGLRHREWLTEFANPLPRGQNTPFARTLCPNSAYREHLTAMVQEVREKYNPEGFFFDCMSPAPCICPTCVKGMRKLGLNWNIAADACEFSRQSNITFARCLAEAAGKDKLLYFNGIGYEDQAGTGTYLDFECIPTKAGCDYDYLPVVARYMRTLDDRPRVNMTGRFYKWGDFGGLRPRTAIRAELLTGLALGMRPNIGDHFLPGGELCEPEMRQVETIYHELHQLDPWLDSQKSISEVAVAYPLSHRHILNDAAVRGAVRMLAELKIQFDIISLSADWNRYRVLVFPDNVTFSPEISAKVRDFLKNGGKLISSGNSGLDHDRRFLAEWGVEYAGTCPFSPAYFSGEMPSTIYAEGNALRSSGAVIRRSLIRPAVNFGWDGIYPQYYNPPDSETTLPFLTVCGNVAHFSHCIFTGYKTWGAVSLRKVFGEILQDFLPDPLLEMPDYPLFLRGELAQGKEALLLHLMAWIPEKKADECSLIDDDLCIPAGKIRVRCSSGTKAMLLPSQRPLECRRDGEYLELSVPSFSGYALIAIGD